MSWLDREVFPLRALIDHEGPTLVTSPNPTRGFSHTSHGLSDASDSGVVSKMQLNSDTSYPGFGSNCRVQAHEATPTSHTSQNQSDASHPSDRPDINWGFPSPCPSSLIICSNGSERSETVSCYHKLIIKGASRESPRGRDVGRDARSFSPSLGAPAPPHPPTSIQTMEARCSRVCMELDLPFLGVG